MREQPDSSSGREGEVDLEIGLPDIHAFEAEPPQSLDAQSKITVESWRDLAHGLIQRDQKGRFHWPQVLIVYGALVFCVFVGSFGLYAATDFLDSRMQLLTSLSFGWFYVMYCIVPALCVLKHTKPNGLYSKLLEGPPLDSRMTKTVQKLRKRTMRDAVPFSILITALTVGLYFFKCAPSSRTVERTAAVVAAPASFIAIHTYCGHLVSAQIVEIALGTVRWKLRDLQQLAATATHMSLASDEKHGKLVELMRSLAEIDLPLLSRITSPILLARVAANVGLFVAGVGWCTTFAAGPEKNFSIAVGAAVFALLIIYYIALLPSLCTRLSDMCMDVETKLKQVAIRSTWSIDVDRDEAMRATLANAAVVGAMDQTRLHDLIAYLAAFELQFEPRHGLDAKLSEWFLCVANDYALSSGGHCAKHISRASGWCTARAGAAGATSLAMQPPL